MLVQSELVEIKGGAAKWVVGIGIGAIITFIIGVVDGYIRPISCNAKK
ncbi:MAG: class IIb bacteriocin, lactobin A/cerein 7B family [Bacilli bacterium]